MRPVPSRAPLRVAAVALVVLLAVTCVGTAVPVAAQSNGDAVRVTGGDDIQRIRSIDSYAAGLVLDGLRDSPTIRSLALQIARSNVIVHVECASLSLSGEVLLLGVTSEARYLRIRLRCSGKRTSQISVLGHELQHVVEIADATSIVGEASLRAYYDTFGVHSGMGRAHFESLGAIATGGAVEREIRRADLARRALVASTGASAVPQ